MKLSYERYLELARAEAQNGNAVAAENYYQHAEHYFRSMYSGSSDKRRQGASENLVKMSPLVTVGAKLTPRNAGGNEVT